jgi:LacI family transcriptional regulator
MQPKKPGGPSRPEKSIRLLDVAKLAEVSHATAARALGGYGSVDPETREKINAAAASLGYSPNDLARSMRSGRTKTIGLVVADITNSFFNGVARVLVDVAAHRRYRTFVVNTNDEIETEIEAIRALVQKRVDGIVLVPSKFGPFDHIVDAGVPIVILDRDLPGSGIPSVTTDDFDGARTSVGYLIGHGHRRIGLLIATTAVATHGSSCTEPLVSPVRARLGGALAAMAQAGIPEDLQLIRFSRVERAIAKDAALKLLEAEPTAVFATNEEMVIGLLDACRERKLRVSEDISVIGFDEAPWTSVLDPPLTVLERPLAELGRSCVSLLIDRIHGREGASIVLKNTLIERRSVRDLSRQS